MTRALCISDYVNIHNVLLGDTGDGNEHREEDQATESKQSVVRRERVATHSFSLWGDHQDN